MQDPALGTGDLMAKDGRDRDGGGMRRAAVLVCGGVFVACAAAVLRQFGTPTFARPPDASVTSLLVFGAIVPLLGMAALGGARIYLVDEDRWHHEARRWGLSFSVYASALAIGAFFGYVFTFATGSYEYIAFLTLSTVVMYTLVVTVGREMRPGVQYTRSPQTVPWYDGFFVVTVAVYGGAIGFLIWARYAVASRDALIPGYVPEAVRDMSTISWLFGELCTRLNGHCQTPPVGLAASPEWFVSNQKLLGLVAASVVGLGSDLVLAIERASRSAGCRAMAWSFAGSVPIILGAGMLGLAGTSTVYLIIGGDQVLWPAAALVSLLAVAGWSVAALPGLP